MIEIRAIKPNEHFFLEEMLNEAIFIADESGKRRF